MAKKMRKLEKECQSWKSRFDGCNKSLIDMVADVRTGHFLKKKKKKVEMFYFPVTPLLFLFSPYAECNQGEGV